MVRAIKLANKIARREPRKKRTQSLINRLPDLDNLAYAGPPVAIKSLPEVLKEHNPAFECCFNKARGRLLQLCEGSALVQVKKILLTNDEGEVLDTPKTKIETYTISKETRIRPLREKKLRGRKPLKK